MEKNAMFDYVFFKEKEIVSCIYCSNLILACCLKKIKNDDVKNDN